MTVSSIDIGEGVQKEWGFCPDLGTARTDCSSGTKANLFPHVTRRLSAGPGILHVSDVKGKSEVDDGR